MNHKYQKIVNPLSGRKVKIDTPLGKSILQNYLINQQGGRDNDSEYNPEKEHSKLNEKINSVRDTFNKEHNGIIDNHRKHIEKLEEERDDHELQHTNKHLHNYKEATNALKQAQKEYQKNITTPDMKCYRSKSRGTCELEPYFETVTGMEDKDNKDNKDKCVYDKEKYDCYADWSKWDTSDNDKLTDALHTYDYDSENEMFWEEDENTQIPFITDQRISDLRDKGHGTLRH